MCLQLLESFEKGRCDNIFIIFKEQLVFSKSDHAFQTIFKIVLIGLIFGGGIEILQLEVFTYRSAEWWDLFADMLGVAMGIFSYIFLHRGSQNEKSI